MKQVRLVLSLSIFLASTATAAHAQSLSQQLKQESSAALVAQARERGDAARGAVLFAEQRFGCTNCHGAGRTELLGPDLSRLGSDVSDESLVEALLTPSKVIREGYETVTVVTAAGRVITGRIVEEADAQLVLRDTSPQRRMHRLDTGEIEARSTNTVSSMPDDLVNQLQDRKQFLDLTRYVMEIVAAGPTVETGPRHALGGGAISERLRGLVLLNELNCAACHQYRSPDTSLPPAKAPNLIWSSGRIDPWHVAKFVADPQPTKPGTRMPNVMATLSADERDSAANALAQYIVSLSDREFSTTALPEDAAARGRELFHTVGCVACHSPRDATGGEILPEDSQSLGAVASKYGLESLAAFLENPHAARPAGRMPNMQLTHWEAVDVANYLLSGRPQTDANSPAFERDPDLAAKGKEQFIQLGCVKCHAVDERKTDVELIPLTKAGLGRGCLSDDAGAWPQFEISRQDRDAIKAALSENVVDLMDDDRIAMTMTALRCVNCHRRGELGGVSEDRDLHFHTANPNLGPQGRIPPTLTGVGAKLKPTWMRQVLVSGRNIRPYVTTRMPLYGVDNVAHLVDLFQQVDRQPALETVEFSDQKEMRTAGHELAGTRGLNCIVCHTFQLKQAATMPAVDLTDMAERLHKDWFHRYMRNPQRLSQNTVMPAFWPGGRAIRQSVLDGDPDMQIEALWQYLLDGRQARAPLGLIREPMELLATEEAVMLRRRYEGIGKRGIGVGYPSQLNLAFDAEQMRLAMIWRGKFADPGGVWRSQGHGTVRPIGRDLIRFTVGPDVDDAEFPWTVDEGRPPHHQFKGYSLDDKRRPKFEYRIGAVTIEDYSFDLIGSQSEQPTLRRTLTLRSKQPGNKLMFRAADGQEVSALGDSEFLVDKKLRVRIAEPHSGAVVDGASGQQLRVSLDLIDEATVLVVDYVW